MNATKTAQWRFIASISLRVRVLVNKVDHCLSQSIPLEHNDGCGRYVRISFTVHKEKSTLTGFIHTLDIISISNNLLTVSLALERDKTNIGIIYEVGVLFLGVKLSI